MAQSPKGQTVSSVMDELRDSINLAKIRSLIDTLPKRELEEVTKEWLIYVTKMNQYITLQNLTSGNDISLQLLNSTEEGRQFLGNLIQSPTEIGVTQLGEDYWSKY